MDETELLEKLQYKQEDIRRALSGAMELVQTLPLSLKLSFACLALRLGHAVVEKGGLLLDAMHYFKIVLNTVDSGSKMMKTNESIPLSDSDRRESGDVEKAAALSKSEATIVEIRVKAQLSLAYCYKEIGYCL